MITIEETICSGYCNNYEEFEKYKEILEKYGKIRYVNISFSQTLGQQTIEFKISYIPFNPINIIKNAGEQ